MFASMVSPDAKSLSPRTRGSAVGRPDRSIPLTRRCCVTGDVKNLRAPADVITGSICAGSPSSLQEHP